MAEKGYVYVLTNPSFKEDWVKIGKSSRPPELRGKELYNTAVPLPYEIYAMLKTEKFDKAEKLIHKMIDRISDLRITKNREFFNIPPRKAYEILEDVRDLLEEDAEVILNIGFLEVAKNEKEIKISQKEYPKKENNKKGFSPSPNKRFDFYKKGLKNGDIINFVEDESIVATVCDARQVEFEGKKWCLSPLARELYDRQGKASFSGSYRGPQYFKFHGKRITEIADKWITFQKPFIKIK